MSGAAQPRDLGGGNSFMSIQVDLSPGSWALVPVPSESCPDLAAGKERRMPPGLMSGC